MDKSSMTERHVLALRGGHVVHAAELTRADRGLACGATCASCGQPLVAKIGPVRARHFSHRSGTHCAHASESALHLAAKEILERRGMISLPPVEARSGDVREVVSPARTMLVDRVITEMRLEGVVADVAMIESGAPCLLVEIRVAHPCGADKIRRLAGFGIPCIEVDLRGCVDEDGFDREELEHLLTESGVAEKEWLHAPGLEEAGARVKLLARRGEERRRQAEETQALKRPRCTAAASAHRLSDSCRTCAKLFGEVDSQDESVWIGNYAALRLSDGSLPKYVRQHGLEFAWVVGRPTVLWQSEVWLRCLAPRKGVPVRVRDISQRVCEWHPMWFSRHFLRSDFADALNEVVGEYLDRLTALGYLRRLSCLGDRSMHSYTVLSRPFCAPRRAPDPTM